MSRLTVPVVAVILGRGKQRRRFGSGRGGPVLMLEHSVYCHFVSRGFASILWKDAGRSQEAAGLMKLTAPELLRLGVIDEVILEPVGGAIWLPPLRTGGGPGAVPAPVRSQPGAGKRPGCRPV